MVDKRRSDVFNMDNLVFMRNCSDNEFDVAVVDPEYLNLEKNKTNHKCLAGGRLVKNGTSFKDFSGAPDEEYFYHLFRVSKHQFIFGGNYFTHILNESNFPYLHPNNNWFVWHKQVADANWSMHEMAWTSIENNARSWRFSPMGKVCIWHPTSKPIELYNFIFNTYLLKLREINGGRLHILDTNLGSGSSRQAAFVLGYDFTGIEISEKFFKLSCKDFNNYIQKNGLFINYELDDSVIW